MNGSATAVGTIIMTKLTGWWSGFLNLLPNIAAALVVLLLFYLLSRIARWLVRRAVLETELPDSLQGILVGIVGMVVLVVGFITSLSVLGLKKTVTTALAGAGVLGLALGFAFQDVAANFVSGVFLIFRRPFTEGDLIEVKDQLGNVLQTNLRSTKLRTPDGETIYIPNSDVFQNDVTNYSELGVRRVDIDCGVAYDTDLKKAQSLAVETISELDIVEQDRAIEVYYDGFGDSAITFTLRFWIDFSTPADFPKAKDKAVQAIKTAFEDADIDMPFPIRTIKFDNGTDPNQLNQSQ